MGQKGQNHHNGRRQQILFFFQPFTAPLYTLVPIDKITSATQKFFKPWLRVGKKRYTPRANETYSPLLHGGPLGAGGRRYNYKLQEFINEIFCADMEK